MLENFLQPIDTTLFSDIEDLETYQVGRHIEIFLKGKLFPSLKNVQIAIIGVGVKEANEVRQAFYTLSFQFKHLKMVDLGNLNISLSIEINQIRNEMKNYDVRKPFRL